MLNRRNFLLSAWLARGAAAKGPELPVPPPKGAVVLFGGTGMNQWEPTLAGDAHWSVVDGCLTIDPSSGHKGGDRCRLATRESFGDYRLHLEFRLPLMADKTGQARSNSGVFIGGRYEVQMLDTYGHPPELDGAGALYKVAAPRVNASFPPEEWQSFDIDFRSARMQDGKVTGKPRISVVYNGVKVHEDVELHVFSTPNIVFQEYAQSAPIYLQNHRAAVRFRNIWLVQARSV